MNKKNLILTATAKMTRPEWLAFRQPLTHIKKHIVAWSNDMIRPTKPIIPEQIFRRGDSQYRLLKKFFDSAQWKNFQFPCLGASEVATVMALNPYKSIIELYFEKIGAKDVHDFDNAAMFWGRELEEQIAEKWQYWEGTPESMIDNFKIGNIIRRCRRVNAYVQNVNHPWIFASLDRLINKHYTGEETVNEGSLECKTIVGYAADMWESGIPVMYVAQLQTQLLVVELKYGEIAILKDGRYFELYPFDKHDKICERIIEKTKKFYEMVKAGCAHFLLHLSAETEHLQQYHYSECERISPEPDGSEAYKNYLSEKYINATGEGILGGDNEKIHAQNYKYFAARINEQNALQREAANHLKHFMKETSKIDLGDMGTVTWRTNRHGTRTFKVNIKIDDSYQPKVVVPKYQAPLKPKFKKKTQVKTKKPAPKKKAAPKKKKKR